LVCFVQFCLCLWVVYSSLSSGGRRGRDRMMVRFTTTCAISSATGRWFSPCTPVSSTNKTNPHDIIESSVKHHKTNLTNNYIKERRWRQRKNINSCLKVYCKITIFQL
jgi:hypothetical protein